MGPVWKRGEGSFLARLTHCQVISCLLPFLFSPKTSSPSPSSPPEKVEGWGWGGDGAVCATKNNKERRYNQHSHTHRQTGNRLILVCFEGRANSPCSSDSGDQSVAPGKLSFAPHSVPFCLISFNLFFFPSPNSWLLLNAERPLPCPDPPTLPPSLSHVVLCAPKKLLVCIERKVQDVVGVIRERQFFFLLISQYFHFIFSCFDCTT